MRRVLPWIEGVLRRYPWVIVLFTIVLCAWFLARGTNDLVFAKLFAADTEALARPIPGATTVAAPTQNEVNHHVRERVAIIHRNVFDSDAGCLDCDAGNPDAATAEAAPGAPPAEEEILPPEVCDTNPANAGKVHPQPCESSAKVLGAVQSEDILWSFVFVQATAGGATMPYRFGQTLEGRTVGIISFCRDLGAYALLRSPSGGPRCFLAQNMPPRQAPPPTPVAAPVTTPAAPPGGDTLAAALEGIERTGSNQFNVRRATVDRILESQAELMRTTRIMPHEEGGRVTGVQLFGVRGNSLLGRLGLQNGDILNRINGLEIASPDRALEAYSRLRTSDQLQVSVTRNGQPVNIDFNIVNR